MDTMTYTDSNGKKYTKEQLEVKILRDYHLRQAQIEEEVEFDMCCGCGKFNDTRPMCDCGSSHRENCSDCDDEDDYCDGGCGKKEIWDCSDRHMCKTCHFKKEEEEEEDVCCVGCGEYVCKFNEEPNHKDDRDEAVCDECCGEEEEIELLPCEKKKEI